MPLAFAICATLTFGSARSDSSTQEMQYPGYAGLDAEFLKIKFRCDVAIPEAFADQAISWAQHSHFSPEGTREANLHIRFFERNRGALDQRFVRSARAAGDSRGLWRTFRFAGLAQADV